MSQDSSAAVFVVGMNGSGTTMLADSLGRHSQIYMFPRESKVIPFFMMRKNRYGDLGLLSNRRLLAIDIVRSSEINVIFKRCIADINTVELVTPCFPGVFIDLFGHLASLAGKTRWGEKSPINTQYIAELSELFEHARFVHIIRDGRDAAQSLHRRWGYSPMHTIWRWKHVVQKAREDGKKLGPTRYLEVRYEDLTEMPVAELKAICSFLNLPFEPTIVKSSMRMMDSHNPAFSEGRIAGNSGKWTTYFKKKEISSLEHIAGDSLSEFGYEVTQRGDHEPSYVRVKLWEALHGIQYVHWWFFKRPKRGSLRQLSRALRGMAAQWSSNRF